MLIPAVVTFLTHYIGGLRGEGVTVLQEEED